METVNKHSFEKAKDKIVMGVEKKTYVMSEDEKRMTAYHEAGHAIVGRLMPSHDPIYKVSIIPRGRALGITMFLPEKDTVSISKQKLEGQISTLYAGRIAEELYAGEDLITTGASNDIERATELASLMVTEWGMSKKVLPIKYVDNTGFGMEKKFKSGSPSNEILHTQRVWNALSLLVQSDPSVAPGIPAALNSTAQDSSGNIYAKTGLAEIGRAHV